MVKHADAVVNANVAAPADVENNLISKTPRRPRGVFLKIIFFLSLLIRVGSEREGVAQSRHSTLQSAEQIFTIEVI